MFERRGREVVAGGDFRRSRRRERGAKDLVRRHFFLFFFFFFFVVACACTRPRRVKERYTLSKEKIYVVNARKKKTTRQARRGATPPSTEECVCLGFSYGFGGLGLFLPPLFYFVSKKKNTSCALEPKHICLSFSTLERSDIHTLQSLW